MAIAAARRFGLGPDRHGTMGSAGRFRNSQRPAGQSGSPPQRGSTVQPTDLAGGDADMDVHAESAPVWTTAPAQLQCSVAVALAGVLGLFPGGTGSGDENAHHTAMVAYCGAGSYEGSHAPGQLRGQRVVSHSHGDGQEYDPASGV